MTEAPKPADSVTTAQVLYEIDQAMADLELLCLNLLAEVAAKRSALNAASRWENPKEDIEEFVNQPVKPPQYRLFPDPILEQMEKKQPCGGGCQCASPVAKPLTEVFSEEDA